MCSMRTIKSDVVVGLGENGDRIAEKLDREEEGWKISGKYVSPHTCRWLMSILADTTYDMSGRRSCLRRPTWRASSFLLSARRAL